jgi:formyltetrahydrofolate-dependent phosphoribosylglycinamide formyltransferase
MIKPRIAILISGTGTNMEAIVRACLSGELEAEVTFVGSDRPGAKGLTTATALGMQTKVFPYKINGREVCEKQITEAINETKTDWIILAGFMRILSPDFVHIFKGRIINIHPALLPLFPGAHGIQDAWNAGVHETGVTVHLVDEKVDHGQILAQEKVKRLPDDTIETLEARIHETEHKIYKQTLKMFFTKNPIND